MKLQRHSNYGINSSGIKDGESGNYQKIASDFNLMPILAEAIL